MAQDQTVNSAGQVLADSTWLDLHFEADRPEYEQIVQSVGIEPGWHVLDAGCGTGSFIPLLAELVGPNGRITAIDHAAETIESVRSRLESSPVGFEVELKAGSLLDIPLSDDSVDAVWIANVLMYLSDDELATALLESNRVTRPGGLVVAKEADIRLAYTSPLPMHLLRELGMVQPIPPRVQGALRPREHIHLFRESGLDAVRQWTVLGERNAPLSDVHRQYFATHLIDVASARLSQGVALSPDARHWLEAQLDPKSPDAAINHPHFSHLSGHVVTVGRVP